jgi:predicted lipoprotein with Yx(FWY)xxD motif
MGEKRGQLEKLKYDFNTAQAVYIKFNNKMHRISERDFRSYNGDRYIYTKQDDGIYQHVPYHGPLYYYNTNKKCLEPKGEGLIQYLDTRPWNTTPRAHERFK